MKLKTLLSLSFFSVFALTQAQNNTAYWQQHVDYKMEVDMNVEDYNYTGKQELVYTNNSPDTLNQVFYHLYFNAFQPDSEMDIRSLTIKDPDRRVVDRISKLEPDEIGFLKVNTLSQDGSALTYNVAGTVLEVNLAKPIAPGESTTFKMDFNGQVPVQIRRSGRNNAEGVALSMTQWYPKLAEYDFEGWHADPYIAREFHGVWGDFDVKITIDSDYTIGGTGYLQNTEIGHGYGEPGQKAVKPKKGKYTWHFIAPNVHDFTWAADPEYIHDKLTAEDGTVLHFFYKDNKEIIDNWKKLQPKTAELLAYYNEHIGQYPYDQYSVIQGGDGGMEYAMCTLITGERSFGSLVGVTAHEFAHTWFQFLMATNEQKHEWMDEGFTSYISDEAMNTVMEQNNPNPQAGNYNSYFRLAKSGFEQPQTTYADRYALNAAYGASAYSKGAVFLAQLGYIIGKENLDKTLKQYFDKWHFKHPTPNDFKRVAEKVSGMQLDWYLVDWTQTINTIDYAIKNVEEVDGKTQVTLERKGLMPMPIDFYINTTNDENEAYYIPLRMMRAEKANPFPEMKRTQLEDWTWANPTYTYTIDKPLAEIKAMTIDAQQLMADIDRTNNSWSKETE
ncbi:peptidase M1-like protein [Leeuwenhoekiella aestuarii]|uniref:Peptidase M1-like protein n=1 Tax=Leeuwenhoekiella aestuarii TaxID=2249426 RepID=A0A4Q0P063_9FLAO|nr:M1 family metallopeptidase [Leeuwenhoekiella aestuarii]RXG17956.1 peptidase M1-like protein [Leeuwenhoekiella aestuarii]RXG19285.1 peptidase M1-like protein [Leeuwenhoekiella aestuarii]